MNDELLTHYEQALVAGLDAQAQLTQYVAMGFDPRETALDLQVLTLTPYSRECLHNLVFSPDDYLVKSNHEPSVKNILAQLENASDTCVSLFCKAFKDCYEDVSSFDCMDTVLLSLDEVYKAVIKAITAYANLKHALLTLGETNHD